MTSCGNTKNEKLKLEGTYFKAQAEIIKSQQGGNGKLNIAPIDAFLKLAPKDPRAGRLLYMAAMSESDEKAKTAPRIACSRTSLTASSRRWSRAAAASARRSASPSSWSSPTPSAARRSR